MAAIAESFVCAGVDTAWSLKMDVGLVGACADTSDADATVELKLWGCRRWFLVLVVPAPVPVGL